MTNIVSIIGWFGSGNLGDEAILIGELQAFRKIQPKLKINVFSFNPELTRNVLKKENIENINFIKNIGKDIWQADWKQIFSALRYSDLILIGGGGMLQDAYNWYTLPYFCFWAFIAKAVFGKKTLFFCVGAGPIKLKFNQKLIFLTSKIVDKFLVRGQESKGALIKCSLNPKDILVFSDPGFNLELGIKNYELKIDLEDYIAVCIREVKHWFNLEICALASVFDKLSRKYQTKIVFLPFGRYNNKSFGLKATENDDLQISEKIAELMETEPLVIKDFLSASEALSIISQAKFLIGFRLHSLIMAARAGIPFIALTSSFDSKLSILAKDLKMEEYLVDLENFEEKEFLEKMKKLNENLLKLKEKLSNAGSILEKRAVEAAKFALSNPDFKKTSLINSFQLFLYFLLGCFYLSCKTLIFRKRV